MSTQSSDNQQPPQEPNDPVDGRVRPQPDVSTESPAASNAHDVSTHGTGTDTGPDHSEREWGGDQDIDTAGQVPGNAAGDPTRAADEH